MKEQVKVIARRKLALKKIVVSPAAPVQEPVAAPAAAREVKPLSKTDIRRLDEALGRVRALLVGDAAWREQIETALAGGDQVHVRIVLQRRQSGVRAHVDTRAVRSLKGTALCQLGREGEAANDGGVPDKATAG